MLIGGKVNVPDKMALFCLYSSDLAQGYLDWWEEV